MDQLSKNWEIWKRNHPNFYKLSYSCKRHGKAEDKIDEKKLNISRERNFKEMTGSEIHMEMKIFYQKIMDEN